MNAFSTKNATRAKIPRVAFSSIKERVLGKRYNLSLVVIGAAQMTTLNRRYRRKDTPTDILAFSLSKTSGEIFIHPPTLRKKARAFSMSERHYLAFVFIHGCLHLKGLPHGRTMDRLEGSWCRAFSIPPPRA